MSNQTLIYDDEKYIIEHELGVVLRFKYTASALSIIGSLFMICSYLYFKFSINDKKSNKNCLKMGYGHDLLFCLAISDFIHSISSFVKTHGFLQQVDSNCIAQGILMNFGEVSSVSWTSIIALSIYLGTVYPDFVKARKYFLYIYVYSISILLTFLPLSTNSYGQAGAWCWFNTKDINDVNAWRWSLCLYIFHWSNILFNIFAVYKSIRYFKIRAFEIKEDNKEQSNFLRNFCIMLKFFPIILIICWVPATINRIYLFSLKIENTFLYTIHAFFTSLIGFLNAIVYSYYYKSHLKTCICPKVEVKENENNTVEMAHKNEYVKNITDQDIENKEKSIIIDNK